MPFSTARWRLSLTTFVDFFSLATLLFVAGRKKQKEEEEDEKS